MGLLRDLERPRRVERDAVIARAVDFFRWRGRPFEWKWYGYDRPADLPTGCAQPGSSRTTTSRSSSDEVDDVVDRLAGPPTATVSPSGGCDEDAAGAPRTSPASSR